MNQSKKYIVTDRMVTKITAWMAGIIVLVLLVWGVRSLLVIYKAELTNDAQVQEYINPVISRAGGFITDIRFEENQEVHKGDTLLLIDNREYKIQEEQTAAALNHSSAQVVVLESNIQTLKKTAQVNNSQIAVAKAKLEKQQLDYDRYQRLFETGSATKQQLEHIKSAYDIANSEYQAALDAYQASLAKVGEAATQRGVINAESRRLSALLDRHRLDASYTVILAPYNGRMGRRTIETGQMINAGETLAYIVNSETDKWVVANYKETQVRNMKVGDTADIEADAYPGTRFKGCIISLSPATGSSFSLLPPDNTTGNYVKIVQRIPVRIRLTDAKAITAPLKAGMNVNVSIRKNQYPHG
ncbi:HlyD family secretion protein [Chitinophaga sp. 212800010-3]|uniref:HlyD family secretion protein n=1 Tax=unclassified Chitinophaga TaxID=2619133 RepID=UPI002DEBF6C3|nr:Multidrug export protein EmrA [Chitinophaga sp. 212800010-3]